MDCGKRRRRGVGSRLVRDESGIALVTMIFLIGLLVAVSVSLEALTSSVGTRSVTGVRTNNALQAAESGANVYVADLTEDSAFYLDYVAAGEARRTYGGAQYPATAGSNADANVSLSPSWPATSSWAYPTDVSTDPGWRTVGSSVYQYLLEIFPDVDEPNEIRIIAIGRPTPTAAAPASDTANYRAIEVYVNALSISDFQMLSAANIGYGDTATTNGWVYATLDDNGNPTSISHEGTATADLFTEDNLSSYSGNPKLVAPAREYASNSTPSIRTVINEPITFSELRQSNQIAPETGGEGAIELDAASNGITLDPTSSIPDAWWLKFQPGGTVDVYSCLKAYTTSRYYGTTYYPVAYDAPTCTFYNTYTLNAGPEEIYTTEDVIVSGTVAGQVTIYTAGGGQASVSSGIAKGDIIIGDDISYASPGSDVLGMVANTNVIIACWEPESNLSWTGATISLNGEWASDWDSNFGKSSEYGSYCSKRANNSMTFTGSTATDKGGSMGGFNNRTYNYDPTLRYLPPPDYPEIPSAFKIMYERQIAVP